MKLRLTLATDVSPSSLSELAPAFSGKVPQNRKRLPAKRDHRRWLQNHHQLLQQVEGGGWVKHDDGIAPERDVGVDQTYTALAEMVGMALLLSSQGCVLLTADQKVIRAFLSFILNVVSLSGRPRRCTSSMTSGRAMYVGATLVVENQMRR